MKHLLFATALAASALTTSATAAPAPAAPAHASTTAIDIKNFMFMTVTVPAGTTVTWTNRDEVPHTVRETHNLFRSAALDTGDSFSYTFTQPGTYDYYCSLHPQMVAKVIVTGPPAKTKRPG